MKWEQLVSFHRSFFPKIRLTLTLNWQVFWLTSLFAAFPSRSIETVADIAKSSLEVYSCGYSSGFAPDSLFIEVLRRQNTLTNNRCTSIRYSGLNDWRSY